MPDLDIGDFLIECANSDSPPEELIELYGEEMDGGDIPLIFEILADSLGYTTIHEFLVGHKSLARDIIDGTQPNPNKSWNAIWKIAILQESLEFLESERL
jgi:hypothetical protein